MGMFTTRPQIGTGRVTRYQVFVSSQQAWCQVPSVPSALPGVTQLPVIRCQLPPCKVPDFQGKEVPPSSLCHRTGNISSTKIQDRSTPIGSLSVGVPPVPALSLGTECGRRRISLQVPAYVFPEQCQCLLPVADASGYPQVLEGGSVRRGSPLVQCQQNP